jgi:hypothetical protein
MKVAKCKLPMWKLNSQESDVRAGSEVSKCLERIAVLVDVGSLRTTGVCYENVNISVMATCLCADFIIHSDSKNHSMRIEIHVDGCNKCHNEFRGTVPNSPVPNKSTVSGLMNRFCDTGRAQGRQREGRPSVSSDDSLDNIGRTSLGSGHFQQLI